MALGRPKPTDRISSDRQALQRLTQRRKTAQALALRARIVLRCAEAGHLTWRGAGSHPPDGGHWRQRFVERRWAVCTTNRAPAPRAVSDADVERVITKTLGVDAPRRDALETALDGQGLGLESDDDLSHLAPPSRSSRTEPDVQALEGSAVVEKGPRYRGLYLNPPDRALVLCADEKSQIQALDRTQPCCRCGRAVDGAPRLRAPWHDLAVRGAGRQTGQDYRRLPRRHRAVEFRRFLEPRSRGSRRARSSLDPRQLRDAHRSGDPSLAAEHPRFHLHFTPTGALLLNLVSGGSHPDGALHPRGVHRSTRELEAAIEEYLAVTTRPQALRWTKTADAILGKVATFCRRSLVRNTSGRVCLRPRAGQRPPGLLYSGSAGMLSRKLLLGSAVGLRFCCSGSSTSPLAAWTPGVSEAHLHYWYSKHVAWLSSPILASVSRVASFS